jgi:hypothetical protein
LQAASLRGHEKVMQILINTGTDMNAQSELYNNVLQAALFRNHDKIIRMFMDMNARGGKCDNVLQGVSYENHEKVIQILINTGADVNV